VERNTNIYFIIYTKFIIAAVPFKQFSNNNVTTPIVHFKQKALFKKINIQEYNQRKRICNEPLNYVGFLSGACIVFMHYSSAVLLVLEESKC
jgi:hypothetical protein